MSELTSQEYLILVQLRIVAKMLNRICAIEGAFRSPLLRRLLVTSSQIVHETVTEIESYDPTLKERENTDISIEADVAECAERTVRQRPSVRQERFDIPLISALMLPKKKRKYTKSAKFIAHLTSIKKCPHCGKEGKGPVMNRLHFDRCKKKDQQKVA